MEVLSVIAVITDVDRICRTCLAEKETLDFCYLFDNDLDQVLWKLTDFRKPILGDGLPTYVCKTCVAQIKHAFAFKEQCKEAENKLRETFLLANPQKSQISLKELLDTGEERFLENNLSIFTDAAVQTEILPNNKTRKKPKYQKKKTINTLSKPENLIDSFDSKLEKTDELKTEINKENEETIVKTGSKYSCAKCKKIFRTAAGLRVHSIRHGRNLQCDVCHKKFALLTYLKNHMKIHKDHKPHVCKLCKKGFSSAGNLSKHMRVHGGEKRHLCVTCGKRFFEPGHLVVHMRTHTGEKPIICKVCGKGFSDPHGLVAHNKVHTGEKNYECKTCGKRFAHSFVLTAHHRVHTGEKPYKCSICGASYATSSYLTIHKRTHTYEKPFICDLCSKAFVSRCALVAHRMVHTGEKRFQCSVCGKRAARSADLNIHMRTHTGERPYSCDQCPKSYHTSSNLSAHKRTHLGIKNHVCTICDKAFGDVRTLKIHTRVHTGEKPYECHVCGKKYSQSGQLSGHKKQHFYQSKQTSNQLVRNLTDTTNQQLANFTNNLDELVPVLNSTTNSNELVEENSIPSVAQFMPYLKLEPQIRPSFNGNTDSDVK